MCKIVMLMIAVFLSFPCQAGQEQEAWKHVLKATAKTSKGREIGDNLEKMLYIDHIPDEIKQLAPVVTIIVEQKISFKWTF